MNQQRPVGVIRGGGRPLADQVREIWGFRELPFLVWRDVKVRYKQTFFGVAWGGRPIFDKPKPMECGGLRDGYPTRLFPLHRGEPKVVYRFRRSSTRSRPFIFSWGPR